MALSRYDVQSVESTIIKNQKK